jgi:hypothetical protein
MYASTPSGTVGPEEMVGRIVTRLEGGPPSHEKAIDLHKEAERRLLNALQCGDLTAEFEATAARRRAISMNFWQTGEGLVSFDQRRVRLMSFGELLLARPQGDIFFVDGVRFAAWLESFAKVPNTNQAAPLELSGESALIASASPAALAEVAASEPEAVQPIPDEAPTPTLTESSDQPGPKPGNSMPLKAHAIPVALAILKAPDRPANKHGWKAELARRVFRELHAGGLSSYQLPSITRVLHKVVHPDGEVKPRRPRRN